MIPIIIYVCLYVPIQYNPIKTIKTNTQGTLNMLGLAKRVGVRTYVPLPMYLLPYSYCALCCSLLYSILFVPAGTTCRGRGIVSRGRG